MTGNAGQQEAMLLYAASGVAAQLPVRIQKAYSWFRETAELPCPVMHCPAVVMRIRCRCAADALHLQAVWLLIAQRTGMAGDGQAVCRNKEDGRYGPGVQPSLSYGS